MTGGCCHSARLHRPRPALTGGSFVFQNKTTACQGKLLKIKARQHLIQGAAFSQNGSLPCCPRKRITWSGGSSPGTNARSLLGRGNVHSSGDSCNNEETLGRRRFPLQTAQFVCGSLLSLPESLLSLPESCIIEYEIFSLINRFPTTIRPRCVVIPQTHSPLI